MGDLPSAQAIFCKNWSEAFRYIHIRLKQLLFFQSLHTGSNYIEVFEEVQADELRGDDDFPAEHANEGME